MVEILYEDNHLLALNKPAGLLTQGDMTGELTLLDWAADDLRRRYDKPGNVYLGLVHRLDQPVSGVVLLAKTSKAASRLSEQFRKGDVVKRYLAIVEGVVGEDAGEWTDTLRKDAGQNVVEVVPPGSLGGKDARLEYRVLEREAGKTSLELLPKTGRSHQLRVQLASRGFPILGDRKYGSRSIVRASDGGLRIALHASELTITHPTRRESLSLVAPVPADWPGRGFGHSTRNG